MFSIQTYTPFVEPAALTSLKDEISTSIAYSSDVEGADVAVVETAGSYFLEGYAPSCAVAERILRIAQALVGNKVFSRLQVD